MLHEQGKYLEGGPDEDHHHDDEHDELPDAPALDVHGVLQRIPRMTSSQSIAYSVVAQRRPAL